MNLTFFKDELVRRGTIVFVASLTASLVALVANFMFSTILGDEFFGTFKTVIYLFTFLLVLFDFGINTSLTKYISEYGKRRLGETKHLIVWFLKMKVLINIILIVVFFLLREYAALYFLKDIALSDLIIAGLFTIVFGFFSTFGFIVMGFQNFKIYGLSQIIQALASGAFAVFFSQFGLFYMIVGYGMGALVGSLPNIWFLMKKELFKEQQDANMKKIFINFSLPIYPFELSAGLINAIVPLMSLFFNPTLISYYSFAFMFYYATALIPNSLSTVLFPRVSELCGMKEFKHAKSILKKALLYYALFAIIGIIGVQFLSEWFISIYAPVFLPSLFMFKVIVSLGLLIGFNVIYTFYLKGMGRIKKFALMTILQNIILIAVSFVIISTA